MGFWLQRSVSRCRAKLARKLNLSAYKRPLATIKRRRKPCWKTCLRMQKCSKSLLVVLERTRPAAMMLKRISELKATSFTYRTRLKIIQWTWQRETRLWRLLLSRASSIIISSNSLLMQGHSLVLLVLSPRPKNSQAPIASSIPPSCSNTHRKFRNLRTMSLFVVAARLRYLNTLIFEPSSHQFSNEALSSRNSHRALDRLTTWVAVISGRKVIALACVIRPS